MSNYYQHVKNDEAFIITNENGNSFVGVEANDALCRIQSSMRLYSIPHMSFNETLNLYVQKSPLWENVTNCIYKNDPTV